MGITLQNIKTGYGHRTLIENASASIPSGSITALLGRNGTGKSTLLRVIAGLKPPMEGRIVVDGREISSLSTVEKATMISFVTTDKVRISNLSCQDVVSLGRAPYTNWIGKIQDVDREIVSRSLALVGMEDFAEKSMEAMSDGECQRIMIARALAQDTPVILLDEPTAFLDLPNRYELCLLLRKLTREERKCIIFSTHDMDIALSLCDSIALIDTPHMHYLPTVEMAHSGHIERLFSGGNISFDPLTQRVILKK